MKILRSSFLLIPILLVSVAFSPAKKKYPYTPEEAKFSIVFPGEYSTEVDSNERAVTYKTSCTLNNQTYFASYTVHQVKMEMDQQKDLAQVSCDSFVKTVGGDLVSNEEWKIKDNSGLIAKINIPASDVKIEYRVFVKDFIQYQLVVLAANSNFDEKAAANFFKSFKLNT